MPEVVTTKLFAEIIRDRFLRGVFVRRLHPVVAVVDAPQIGRDAFAEMAEDDLQLRVLVEQARADQPQRMHGGFGMERPVRPEQPVVAVVAGDRAGQRIARMQIERHVELGDVRQNGRYCGRS